MSMSIVEGHVGKCVTSSAYSRQVGQGNGARVGDMATEEGSKQILGRINTKMVNKMRAKSSR